MKLPGYLGKLIFKYSLSLFLPPSLFLSLSVKFLENISFFHFSRISHGSFKNFLESSIFCLDALRIYVRSPDLLWY